MSACSVAGRQECAYAGSIYNRDESELMTDLVETIGESGEFNRMDGTIRTDRRIRSKIHRLGLISGTSGVAIMVKHNQLRMGAAMGSSVS